MPFDLFAEFFENAAQLFDALDWFSGSAEDLGSSATD